MKICRYKNPHLKGLPPRLGVIYNGQIIDPHLNFVAEYEREGLFNPWERAEVKCPSSLSRILSLYENPFETIESGFAIALFNEKIGELETAQGIPLFYSLASEENSITSPLDSIHSFRDFFSYEEHAKKAFKGSIPKEWYEGPSYFRQSHQSFIGHKDSIFWPSSTKKLDFEAEIGVVIGLEGKNIKEHNAKNHIFGFTIINDISARDIQKKGWDLHLGPGKSKDFCSVVGPIIATADEFDDLEHLPSLNMSVKINDKTISSSNVNNSKYGLSEIISYASKDEWLLPTDLIGVGTVEGGSGFELDSLPKPGDKIEIILEGVGTLQNTFGKPQEEKNW